MKCTLVSPAPCFSQNIHLFFLFQKIAAKEQLVSELGLKMWQSLAIGGRLLDFRGEILPRGVKFSWWDDWNGRCGTKNNDIFNYYCPLEWLILHCVVVARNEHTMNIGMGFILFGINLNTSAGGRCIRLGTCILHRCGKLAFQCSLHRERA